MPPFRHRQGTDPSAGPGCPGAPRTTRGRLPISEDGPANGTSYGGGTYMPLSGMWERSIRCTQMLLRTCFRYLAMVASIITASW